jgi:beta-glucanase (GH16 family)/uncharacterized membrane protein
MLPHARRIVVTAALLTFTVARAALAQTGPIAAYGFNEGSGTTTADASGNGNTGTISGATWNSAGRFGSALSFNGTTNWVTIPDAASLDLTTGMTIEAWVRPASSSGYRAVLMKERTAGVSYAFGTDGSGNAIGFLHPAGGSDIGITGTSIPLNTWTHLAATYDGATFRVYVNGVQAVSRALTGSIETSSAPLRIGGNAPFGQYFSGLIDEVRVYNRALTATAIQADMTAAIGPSTPPSPDFTVAVSPASRSIVQGASTTYTVTVGALNGFTGTVALSAAGLPSGATASFSPGSVTGSGTSTATITTAAGTPTGSSTITFTGTSGTLTRSATATLTITAAPVADFTIARSPTSRSVARGSSTTFTLTISALNGFTGTVALSATGLPSGASASFSPGSVAGSGTSTVTITTLASTPLATSTITFTGTSGSLTRSTTATLTVNTGQVGDFTITRSPSSRTITQGGSTTYTVTIAAVNGFTGSVLLSASGLPAGASASFSPASVSTSGTSTVTITTLASTPTGTPTLTFTGTSGSLTRSTTATLTVNAAPVPDFTIAVSPSSRTITQGSSAAYTVTVGAVNGFTGSVTLSVDGLLSDASASFSPPAITTSGTSTLTVTTTQATALGSTNLTFGGSSGSLSHSATAALTVNAPPPPDFTLALAPSSAVVAQGNSASYTVTIGPLNGFTGQVDLSASALPDGASASFSPESVTTSGTSTLTLTTSPTTPAGATTFAVTGSNGGLTHNATASVSVASSAASLISIDFVGTGAAMGAAESAGVVAAANWNSATGTSRSTPLALVNSTGAATTATVRWTASTSRTLPVTDQAGNRRMMRGLIDASSFGTASVTVAGLPLAAYDVYVYADGDNGSDSRTTSYAISGTGFSTSTVVLTDASGTNFNATFTRAQSSAGNYVRFSITGTGFTITATPGSSSSSTRRAPVNGMQIVPIAPPAPTFSLAVSPASATIDPGSSAVFNVSVTPANGFNGDVTLSAAGVPASASADFTPAVITAQGTATLTITTTSGTPAGQQPLTVTGTSGALQRTANASLTVTTFSITGTITPAIDGAGTTVVLGGAAAATATANASGLYTFSGLPHGDYTVTPQRAGYTFTPLAQNVSVVNADVSGVNFTAQPPTFAISGTLVPVAGGAGASLSLNGRVARTTVADESGGFVFTGVPNGTYQITVSNTGYAFTPSALLVTVADEDLTGIAFSAEPVSDPMPVGPTGPWTLTFRDEFDGSLLDRTKWATAYGNGMRTNNDELEWYVDDDATHVVSDGTLRLTAFAQSSEPGFPYTSGMISSHDAFNQMYGYFEARVKLPSGRGLWPALWTLPIPATWPPEIDIMENLGHDCTTVYTSNHWSAAWPDGVGEPRGGNTTTPYVGANFCAGFHTFGVEWTSTYLDFYIDGVRRLRITDHVPRPNAVFSGMYLLANLAVGGSWPGAPNSETVFPAVFEVDYIRAWRR